MSVKGPELSIVGLLDYVQGEEEDKYNAFPLRPSAAGHCTRKLAYDTASYLGKGEYAKEEKPPRVKRLLDLGHHIETHVLRHLYKIVRESDSFRVKYKQQALPLFMLSSVDGEKPPEIEGALDLAIEMHGKLGFVDVKSYGEKWSNFYKNKTGELYAKFDKYCEKFDVHGWWIEDLPKFLEDMNDPFLSDNFYQLNAYCHSDFAKRKNVEWASIIKYNKNDSSMWELRFKPHQGMFDEVKEKFQTAYEAGSAGTPEKAKRDYALGSARCGFCDHRASCWPDKDALKEHFATWPKKTWPRDTDRLAAGSELEALFKKYETAVEHSDKLDSIEKEITKILTEHKEKKIRLKNGNVYEMKALKSGGVGGGPRMVIRRSKL